MAACNTAALAGKTLKAVCAIRQWLMWKEKRTLGSNKKLERYVEALASDLAAQQQILELLVQIVQDMQCQIEAQQQLLLERGVRCTSGGRI